MVSFTTNMAIFHHSWTLFRILSHIFASISNFRFGITNYYLNLKVMTHYFSTLQSSMKKYWDRPALCNYRGETFTFADLATQIKKFDIAFRSAGIKKGDKIALCAKNTARWAVSFLAINVYEAVVVPILFDFHPDSITHLVDHSDSVLLFCDKEVEEKINFNKMPKLRGCINVDRFELTYSTDEQTKAAFGDMNAAFKSLYPAGISTADISLPTDNMDDLAVVNYTSGTTSAPKGVMLSYRNISASIAYGFKRVHVEEGDTVVSMLPMAHVYGMIYEFLYPMSGGCAIYFLGKTPSPSILIKAMKEVRPYMVCTVPLVMEKIFKSSLKPIVSKWYIKLLSVIPVANQVIFKKMRNGLDEAFGGKVRHYIMGGAALNPEAEKWFKRIGLKYCVGYGMTEAAPLLAYEDWRKYKMGSCGKKVDCVVCRIDSEDPHHIAGEIQVKGDNITMGYYRNEEATKAAFTDDGFFRTGDLGIVDSEGNIFIKGRSKNLILSANGQNIYPEELEAIVNNQQYIAESVVLDRAGKLVALVYLDDASIKKDGLDDETISDIPEKVRVIANKLLPAYSQIAKVEVVLVPFEKTPKMSIKRFLYK